MESNQKSVKSLWDHQLKTIQEVSENGWRKGYKSGVIVIPTGGGKTTTSMEMFARFFQKNPDKRAIFFTERRILAQQAAKAALGHGLQPSLFMANVPEDILKLGIRNNLSNQLQVASWQTCEAANYFPAADFVVIDEGHRFGSSDRLAKIDSNYGNSHKLYLTATPALSDGSTMGKMCQFMVQPTTIGDLIDKKILVPSRLFYPDINELRGLDFIEDHKKIRSLMKKRMNKKNLVGDVVRHWRDLAQERPTFYFGSSVEDSKEVCRQFYHAGFTSVHIDAETPDEQRIEWFDQFVKGKIQVVCNFEVLTYGVDVPEVSCVMMRTPTKSISRLIQIMGRGIRACNRIGKKDCIFLDFAGTTLYHNYAPGFREITWDLSEENLDERDRQEVEKGTMDSLYLCLNCATPFNTRKTRQCPNCGCMVAKKETKIHNEESLAGTLKELRSDGGKPTEEMLNQLNSRWVGILWQCYYGKNTNKLSCAAARFSSEFGFPPWEFKLKFLPSAEKGVWSKAIDEVFPQFQERKSKSQPNRQRK